MNPSKFLDFLFLALLFVPLSVDDPWKFPIAGFHARMGYFAVLLWAIFRFKSWSTSIRKPEVQKLLLPIIAFGLVGIVGTLKSFNLHRSMYFWIWTIGTLIAVPCLMVPDLVARQRAWFFRLLGANMFVHSCIVIGDFVLTRLGHEPIAHVMVYPSKEFGDLFRPHGWYQEPGYFAGFMLVSILCVWLWNKETTGAEKKINTLAIGVAALAIVLTTSRLGWLGLSWFFVAMLMKSLKKISIKKVLAACGLLFVLVLCGKHYFLQVYNHVGQGILNPMQDGSFNYRYARLTAALDVFKARPIFGAGPGGAGALYVHDFPNGSLIHEQKDWIPELTANDPLSQNIYTEILSEWGILGFATFTLFLVLLFAGLTMPVQIVIFGLLAILGTSWQTLPRFDLWVAIAALATFRKAKA